MCTKDPKNHPLRDFLPDGTEIRRVPDMTRTGNRPLYVTFDGRPFSHVLVKDHETGQFIWIYRPVAPILDTCPCNRFNGNREQRYHKMRYHGYIYLHIAVALAWIGEQPTDEEGYRYQCHHLNGITSDNRASNLIWLSRANHRLYDARQKALKEVVPDGNLYLFTYQRLRELQDPRVTSDEKFQSELEALRQKGFHRDPRTTDEIMQYEMSHHMEI